MNILIIAPNFKPKIGGVAEYAHQIATHLHLIGENVFVLSQRMEGDEKFDENCPYNIYRYYDKALSNVHRFWHRYKLIKNLVEKNDIDIIILNHIHSMPCICWLASKLLTVPYCILTHGVEVNAKLSGFKEELIRAIVLKGATKIFCVSSFTQRIVTGKYKIPLSKTSVIYSGISIYDFDFAIDDYKNVSFIKNKFGLKNKRVILSIGRLIERKGFDMVIKAMPKILAQIPNVVYLIVGEGPYEGKLRELVQKHNLEGRVIFAGRISEFEKRYFYKACDIFVMPCRELENGDVEGFGIVFLEANAYGKPVIAGRSGGAVDAVKDDETGLLVDPLDIDKISDAIIYLLNHPDMARRMGEKGCQRVERELNWGTLALRLQQELKTIL